jgi:predicted RNase H-like HicB family nuclease
VKHPQGLPVGLLGVCEFYRRTGISFCTLDRWVEYGQMPILDPTIQGATYEEAVKNGQEVLEDLIALWQDHSYPLPTPRVHASV